MASVFVTKSNSLVQPMQTLLHLLLSWLAADFITGLVHWAIDRYLTPSNRLPFVGKLVRSHCQHYNCPVVLTQATPWENIRGVVVFAWPIAAVVWVMDWSAYIWMSLLFLSFGELVHRWSHMPRRDLPRTVRGLQEFGVFASRSQHRRQHAAMRFVEPSGGKSSRGYCQMSDWLNPVLDHFSVWYRLELLLGFVGVLPKQKQKTCGMGQDCCSYEEYDDEDLQTGEEAAKQPLLIDQLRWHAERLKRQA